MRFINRGDRPLSSRQAEKRGARQLAKELSDAGARPGDDQMFLAITNRQDMSQRMLDILDALPGAPRTYSEYAASWETDNAANKADNQFNAQLAFYRNALRRLEKYRLADGRAEITEEQETGEFDENGDPITETVVVATAIDPLPATVEQPTYDENGNQTGTETVPNPEIVADDAERTAAQAVIDGTPQEVKDFT